MESLHKLIAHGKWTLRARPYRELVAIPFRYSSAGLQRSMLNVCNCVSRLDLFFGRSESRVERTLLVQIGALAAFASRVLSLIRRLLA